MDLDQLPAPPDDLEAAYQELPGYFQACVDIITNAFGMERHLPPESDADGAEAFLTEWLNIGLGPDEYRRPTQHDRVVITTTAVGTKVCIPLHLDHDKRSLIINLLAVPTSHPGNWRGTHTYSAAPWLEYFVECWRVGCYTVSPA
jgi:hypothetical protein